MLKSHSFSPNHKIVSKSPHTFHMPGNAPKTGETNVPTGGGSAEPAGGGAQGPQDAEFCNGGMKYADGGEPESGVMGAVHRAVQGAKDVWDQVTNTPAKGGQNTNPIASGDKDESYEGTGGAKRKRTMDQAIADAGG
jgi:hypothetical protein